jgi:Skp family chaperone for outer membrane proteins
MSSDRRAARRRQRSVRVTVAVTLLGVATVGVALALPTQSPALLSVAAVVAVVLGWAALRMTWTEVLQSRRENATDRAAAARAYRSLFSERAAEHAEFTTAMTERLAESQLTMRELQGVLAVEQRRAARAEHQLADAERRVSASEHRVAELQDELDRRRAEEADALATWEAEGGVTVTDGVEDLVAFDDKVSAAVRTDRGVAETA